MTDTAVEPARLHCPRDDVGTRLRCANCDTPICPQCFVPTEVGFRCPDCGAPRPIGRAAARRRRRRRPGLASVVAVLGAVALAAGVATLIVRQGEDRSTEEAHTELPPVTLEEVSKVVDRPEAGITFDVPADWTVHPFDPVGGAVLATSDISWVRVIRYPEAAGVTAAAGRVVADLDATWRDLRDVVTNPTLIDTRPAWVVRFTLPANRDGTGPPTFQRYYFIQLGSGVVALALGTLNPGRDAVVLDRIAASIDAGPPFNPGGAAVPTPPSSIRH